MEKRVANYLFDNPKSSKQQIAKALSAETSIQQIDKALKELKLEGKLQIDGSPSGDNFSENDSVFYSVKEKYSNAFSAILTDYGLTKYLSSTDRLNNSDYIYHYTTLSRVIEIIKNHTWHLGNAESMNDKREFENGDAVRWKNIFFGSFMTEDTESIGMWSMYSQPWEVGVKIAIPKKEARKWINDITHIMEIKKVNGEYRPTGEKISISKIDIKLASVAYCNTESRNSNRDTEKIQWSNVTNTHIKDACHKKKLTGYIKDMAWSYEKEIRIRAEFDNTKKFKRIAVDLPDVIIDGMVFTGSPLFKGDLAKIIFEETERSVKTNQSLFKDKLDISSPCDDCSLKQNSNTNHK